MRLFDWLFRKSRPSPEDEKQISATVWESIPGGPTRQLVLLKAQQLFPADDPVELIQILDRYGTEQYERERERVQLAVIKLSCGDKDELLRWVETAKMDYRDALSMAEFPQQSQTEASIYNTDLDTLHRIAREDREQYREWLGP